MPNRRRVVVPKHLKQKIVDEYHNEAYAGDFSVKMSQLIGQYFYWTGMKGDIYKKCSSCVMCASVSGQGNRERPALVSISAEVPLNALGWISLRWTTVEGEIVMLW